MAYQQMTSIPLHSKLDQIVAYKLEEKVKERSLTEAFFTGLDSSDIA